MADTIIGDIYNNFEQALNGFYEGAAAGISGYVIPIAWVLLGVCMLIWCYLVMEGKVAMPISDWLLKFIGFMVVLHIMGHGYLSWVAKPIFELPSELTTAMSRTSSSSPDLLGQVNEKMVNLVSAMFTAGTKLLSDLAIGPAVAMFLVGAMTAAAAYLMLGWALFCIIYAKVGLSMVLAVGPFFILALVLPQTRSYFYTWLNTALYFVFFHVLSALFIFMFIGIANSYVNKLNSQLGASSGGGGVMSMVANLIGVGGAGLNVVALCLPLILISLTMFFLFLQIPVIASSLTAGSGGSFGAGLTSAVHFRSMLSRIRSK
ncbi:type IV secretion system protein [Xenophilus azovorans]|uniref:type IV secretion system protein n=1 Tax=Xenophilus azovorans TaxID=151755 RepID=UPI00056ECEC7|nr:type IV secretion system protein [Xenophilus azovorans]